MSARRWERVVRGRKCISLVGLLRLDCRGKDLDWIVEWME